MTSVAMTPVEEPYAEEGGSSNQESPKATL